MFSPQNIISIASLIALKSLLCLKCVCTSSIEYTHYYFGKMLSNCRYFILNLRKTSIKADIYQILCSMYICFIIQILHIEQLNLHKMYRFVISMSCFCKWISCFIVPYTFMSLLWHFSPILWVIVHCHFSTLQTTQFGHFSKVHIYLNYLCTNVLCLRSQVATSSLSLYYSLS